jgi:hypothetical protein
MSHIRVRQAVQRVLPGGNGVEAHAGQSRT